MPKLTTSLGTPGISENAALGAYTVLRSRAVMMHIMKVKCPKINHFFLPFFGNLISLFVM